MHQYIGDAVFLFDMY